MQDWRPAFVAPPSQLAFVATLAVHPALTTGTRNRQKLAASVEAIRYLRVVHLMVGTLESNLVRAYRFSRGGSSTRRGIFIRQRSRSPEAPGTEITSTMATSDSVWISGKNFWSIVGWALNCSIRHSNRWKVWHPWLDHLLSVLYEDWLMQCANTDQSLIAAYLRDNDSRRVMRAIFADGSKTSMQEFGAIWKNELTPPKVKQQTHEKVQVNFETDEFGDYLKDSSEEDEVDKVNKIFEHGTPGLDSEPLLIRDPLVGSLEAVEARMRLLGLLSEVASQSSQLFIDTDDFIRACITSVRPLPVGSFKAVLSMFSVDYFALNSASALIQSLACSLIENNAPRSPTGSLTQNILAEGYLPWAANTTTVLDNVKLSICNETLLRLYVSTHKDDPLEASVVEAAERGIERRESKVQRQGRTKHDIHGDDEPSDFDWLMSSGRRLRRLAEVAKVGPS